MACCSQFCRDNLPLGFGELLEFHFSFGSPSLPPLLCARMSLLTLPPGGGPDLWLAALTLSDGNGDGARMIPHILPPVGSRVRCEGLGGAAGRTT
jgi:hypothetical protein